MTNEYEYGEEDEPEDFNDALDALASASSSSDKALRDIDTVPRPKAGRSPRGTAKVRMDASRRLIGNAWCKSCGESIVGQILKSTCETCGTPVLESVDRRQLGFADRAWLFGLYRGMNLMAVGTLVIIIFSGLGIGFLNFLKNDPRLFGMDDSTVDVLIMLRDIVLSLGSSLIYAISVFQISRPRPDQLDSAFPQYLAKLVRWLILPSLLIHLCLGIGLSVVTGLGNGREEMVAIISLSMIPIYLVQFVGWLLLMVYLIVLAKRIPSPKLAQSTLYVTIAVPGSMVVGFVVLFLIALAAGVSSDPRSYATVLLMSSCMFMLAVLSMLVWYVMVLFRYRRAFAGLVGVDLSDKRSHRSDSE